jgi:protein O-mannosyl-transferase
MLPVVVHYLRLVIWPAELSAMYDLPIKTAIDPEVIVAAVLCVVLIIMGIALYRRRRDRFFWFALFYIGLIPVSQIVPIVTLMNDRYLYFPMLGAAAFLGIVIFRELKWNELLNSPRNIALSACFILIIGAYATVTYQRIGIWRNSATLWGDAVKKAPKLALTHDCFGEGLLQQGRLDEAIGQLEIALSLEPEIALPKLDTASRIARANTRNNLGTAYGMKGMTDKAIEQFSIAIQLNPEFAKAYYNLGNGLMNRGLVAQALRSFENAVRLEPANPAFAANLNMTREIMESGGIRK